MKCLTVGELIEKLQKLPHNAPVFMNSPYDDPDNGPVNAGGPIHGVRTCNPNQYGLADEVDTVVEIWWEGF